MVRGRCTLWGGATANGYGRRKVAGRTVGAHRYAYEQANGPIPQGKIVRHRCDTPLCVNPDHLELGTQADNMQDRLARGRNPQVLKTHCPRNHEYNETNTRTYRGKRHCRACDRERKAV